MSNKMTPVPLAVMMGQGVFSVQGKEYIVKALKLKHIEEFNADKMSTRIPYFDFLDKESVAKLEKWLPRIVFKGDKALSLKILMEDDWDLADLKRLWNEVIGISG